MSDDIKVTDGIILEALNGKVDLDGGNFEGSGLEEVVNNYLAENAGSGLDDKITNCIKEIPQNIKLELNNGKLTLKAGSKVIVPNGAGVFDEVVVDKDLSLTQSWGSPNASMMLFYANGTLTRISVDRTTSGDKSSYTSTHSYVWYDTTNNWVKWVNADGSYSQAKHSLPICIFTVVGDNTSTVTSIDQVFNGMGNIGIHGWIDKGVKILIPNGRNADGTLNNIEHTTQKIIVRQVQYGANSFYWWLRSIDTFDVFGQSEIFVSEKKPTYNGRCEWYNPKENIIRYKKTADSDFILYDGVIVASSVGTDSGVTSLQPKLPFRAVDYNDKQEIISWGLPDYTKGIGITFTSSGLTYTVPNDGYLSIQMLLSVSTLGEVKVNGITALSGISGSKNYFGQLNGQIVVRKGDLITATGNYDTTNSCAYFYPMKGAN